MQKERTLPWQIKVFIIEIPVIIFLLPRGINNIYLSVFLFILFLTFLFFIKKSAPDWNKQIIKYPLLTIIIDTALSYLFYSRWSFSSASKIFTKFINFSPQQSLLIISILIAFFSVFGIDYIISILLTVFYKWNNNKIVKIATLFFTTTLYTFLVALISITLNSECSPLYAFNTWGDPNFMLTVGKGVLKGYVPYRDLYEQKGPLLLFLHTAGAAVSFNSFTGMWILEVCFSFLFLLLSCKILDIFIQRKQVIFFLPMLAAFIYSRWAFQTGDTAEEFCMPFLTYAILFSCKTIKEQKLPTKKYFFFIGVTSGCIFWIKYSMAGFYIGWALFFILWSIRTKQFTNLIKKSWQIILGFLCVSLPILLYFAANKSLPHLFTAYFYNNIFIYTKSESTILQNLQAGFEYLRQGNMFAIVMFLSGIIYLLYKRQWQTTAFLMAVFSMLFFFVFFSEKRFIYYGMIFSIFSFSGLFWVIELLEFFRKHKNPNKRLDNLLFPWSILIGALILCCCSRNMGFLDKQKMDLMQYRIKEIIEQSGIDDPGILEYKTPSTGVYTVTGLIPKIRYFCKFNLDLEEMEKEQETCFREACTDFVIIQTKETYDFEEYEQYIHLDGFEGNIHDTKRPYYYHLYQRKESF